MADKPEQEWIDWAGGKCPVPLETRVETWQRNGFISAPRPAATVGWSWHVFRPSQDVCAYRIAEAA